MTPLQFTRSVRSLNRLRHIAKILTQHGFGHIVARINLARFVPVWMLRGKRAVAPADTHPSAIGRHLTEICTELGPTFIKLAQIASSHPDIVPADILASLQTLQDDVPPFDTAIAMQTIEAELGRPVNECFEWIGDEPIASGSIGQVYQARNKDGTSLVVKIRRPDIQDVINLDMQLLQWLAESLESLMPELAVYRPTMLVAELKETLTRELDYINEAAATTRFGEAFADDVGIRIPKVYWDLTGSSVLTLEELPGTNVERLSDADQDPERAIDRPLVAKRLVDCYLKQVFDLGRFHADPHPGNILVEPRAQVGLIDFGQVGTITNELMTHIVVLVYAAVSNEIGVVIDTLADMGALSGETDRRGLQRSLQILLDKYNGLPMKRFEIATVVSEFTDVIRTHQVSVPRDLTMLLKAMGTMSGVVTRLDPNLDIVQLLAPRLKQVIKRKLAPQALAREAGLVGWQLLNIARHAPGQVREMLRHLAGGRWRLHIRHENVDQLTQELDRSSNRLAFSIVIAAIIVGSSVVISADTTLTLFTIKIQHLGVVGYLIAGIMGLGLSWAIFRSGRLH